MGHSERRLGERDPVDIPILWRLDPERGRRGRRRGGSPSDPQGGTVLGSWIGSRVGSPHGSGGNEADLVERATITDLSVSGASVLARSAEDLVLGSPVVIELDGCRGTVIVCRTQPATVSGCSIYGVAFVEVKSALSDRVWERLGVLPA